MLESGGLLLECIDETYYLVNEQGAVCACLGDVLVFTSDEKNNTFGSLSSKVIEEGNLYEICLSVDPDWLSDPETKYPIVIDPSVNITVDNTTAGEIQDISISTVKAYSAISGSLYVGKNSDSSIRRALMRFEGLNVSGYNITSARILLRDIMCQSTPETIECCKYTGAAWSILHLPLGAAAEAICLELLSHPKLLNTETAIRRSQTINILMHLI